MHNHLTSAGSRVEAHCAHKTSTAGQVTACVASLPIRREQDEQVNAGADVMGVLTRTDREVPRTRELTG